MQLSPPTDRRTLTVIVLAGALVPHALALLGYAAAGRPHVDCDDHAATSAFYRVALPFFALGGLVAAASLVRLTRTGRVLAVLGALVAVDGVLPGGLNHPASAVVVVLGLAAVVGSIVVVPVALGLAVAAAVSWRRHRFAAPARSELRLYTALLGWNLALVLPAVILLLSLNADPICFTF
jgi:hypothetical protein